VIVEMIWHMTEFQKLIRIRNQIDFLPDFVLHITTRTNVITIAIVVSDRAERLVSLLIL